MLEDQFLVLTVGQRDQDGVSTHILQLRGVFTMDVYGHVLPGRQAQMMARFQEGLIGDSTRVTGGGV